MAYRKGEVAKDFEQMSLKELEEMKEIWDQHRIPIPTEVMQEHTYRTNLAKTRRLLKGEPI